MNFIKKKGGKAHASLSLSFHSSKEFSFLNMEQGRCTICGKPASFHSSKEFSFLNGDITVTIDPTAECFHSSKEFSFLNKKDFEPLLSKCYWFPLLKGILIFKPSMRRKSSRLTPIKCFHSSKEFSFLNS